MHLLIEYKPDVCLSTLIANLKTVSSRLIRKENPDLAQKFFYAKQDAPKSKETLSR